MASPALEPFPVCRTAELPPGSRRIAELRGISIGVFNLAGQYFALRNRCPHRSAPLCEGRLMGLVKADQAYAYTTEREGEILRCPWHGWEFDIRTGRSVALPETIRSKCYQTSVERSEPEGRVDTYPVSQREDMVVVWLPKPASTERARDRPGDP
ncbi:MAG: Rieske (2Fe-2S) protein [Opitutaceae bacterium]|nr:Rieske (2Fe-2S) protein [Opitutaceae bacterium]